MLVAPRTSGHITFEQPLTNASVTMRLAAAWNNHGVFYQRITQWTKQLLRYGVGYQDGSNLNFFLCLRCVQRCSVHRETAICVLHCTRYLTIFDPNQLTLWYASRHFYRLSIVGRIVIGRAIVDQVTGSTAPVANVRRSHSLPSVAWCVQVTHRFTARRVRVLRICQLVFFRAACSNLIRHRQIY
jgi:hypothetical protein